MPQRIVRDSILTSERVDQLDHSAEVFYRRLMSVVDDFGRYDARPSILRAACYPLRIDKVREADISRWIAACVKAGLIVLYEVAGKPYLELLNLQDRRRAKHSKYPPPPADSRQHMPAYDSTCQHMRPEAHSESNSEAHSRAPDDESLANQCRQYLQQDDNFIWSQALQDQLVELVKLKGWGWTESAINGCIAEKKPNPIGLLLRRERDKSRERPKTKARSAVAAAGREDN